MPDPINDVLTAFVNDISEHGYDSPERLAYWQQRIKDVMLRSMTPATKMREMIRDAMNAVYRRLIERAGILKYNPDVKPWTIDRVKPQLRNELDRRIMANAELIKLNREQETAKTIQRLSGWATSVPKGGSEAIDKRKVKQELRKSMAGLSYRERRVMIDQGAKLQSALNDIVSIEAGAIAARWHSHYKQANYDFRDDHKDRDLESAGRPYLVRNSWAIEKGLVRRGASKYTDDMTQPGEEVYCRCYYEYIYSLRELPDDMLTDKGKKFLAERKAAA